MFVPVYVASEEMDWGWDGDSAADYLASRCEDEAITDAITAWHEQRGLPIRYASDYQDAEDRGRLALFIVHLGFEFDRQEDADAFAALYSKLMDINDL